MNNITDILFQVHENISFKFHSEIALVKGKKKKYIYDNANGAGYYLKYNISKSI